MAAGEAVEWGKIESLGSFKEMRTKLDGWKRKGQLRAALSAIKVKKHGVHGLLAMGMVLLITASFLRMHLRDVSSSLGKSVALIPKFSLFHKLPCSGFMFDPLH